MAGHFRRRDEDAPHDLTRKNTMGMWSRITRTFRGDRHSAEIEEELQFHLDMDAADGHDHRQARVRLGNVRRIQEETRAVGIIEWLDSTLQDARYGFRQLRGRRG